MSFIIDRLKGSLGFGSTSGSSGGTGHRLGSGDGKQIGVPSTATVDRTPPSDGLVFDLVFNEPSLGMVLRQLENKKPIVDDVVAGGSAASLGVKPNDLIVGVEGNIVESYDGFLEVIGAIGRPVSIRFLRGSSTRSTAPSSSSIGTGKSDPPLSEEEKSSRRIARFKAAEDRGGAWEKRFAANRLKKVNIRDDNRSVFEHDTSEKSQETARQVAAAKMAEDKAVREMGYNPFKPHMSFSAGGNTTAASSSSSAAESRGVPPPAKSGGDALVDDPALVDSLNEALCMLLSTAEIDGPLVQTAITTASKMLKSLADNMSEPKFRSIRVANPHFQSKVAAVPGGLELFTCAGFCVVNEATDTGDIEAFLKHSATSEAELQLHYTLSRLKDLQ